MLRLEQDPNLEANLLKELDLALGDAAAVVALDLADKVSAGTRSGIHWPQDPRRASARGEYPQEQQGDLVRSVDYKKEGVVGEWKVGFFNENQFKLNRLEFGLDHATAGQSTGKGDRKGQRRPLYMLFQGRDRKSTFALMDKAIHDKLK